MGNQHNFFCSHPTKEKRGRRENERTKPQDFIPLDSGLLPAVFFTEQELREGLSMGKRIVLALGGNALGKDLPSQMLAVKKTAKAIGDLIQEGDEIVIVHGNGPRWA
jgi:hypothetical protein